MHDLDDELDRYRTLVFISRNAKQRALSDPFGDYVSSLGVPLLGRRKTDNQAAIKEYFDSVEQSLFQQALLRLVAAFERLAYQKLRNAVGAARTTLDQHYPAQSPLSRAAARLAKDIADFPNLKDLEGVLASYPQSASKRLAELREHRNWIAHGGRCGEQSRFSKIEDVHQTLQELLSAIG